MWSKQQTLKTRSGYYLANEIYNVTEHQINHFEENINKNTHTTTV